MKNLDESIDGYLSLKETAAVLRVSTRTVRRMIARGEVPAYRVGRLIRIRRSDADAVARRIPSA